MKLSSKLFVVLSSVMCTVSIAAEPCDVYGKYDMVACNSCAEHGVTYGNVYASVCCNAIYRHSLGRDDDDIADANDLDLCIDRNKEGCIVYQGEDNSGNCYPGLFCNAGGSFPTCTLIEDDPDACIGGGCASLTRSSWTGTSTQGGPSFVLVVVGLLGAAMLMAMMTVALQRRRHRGVLRRHHYSEVDATATPRIDI
jgi:hypothetical protein